MDKVNIAQKFSLFEQPWSPKIVGEVNDTYIKVVKTHGEYHWHHHETEDELFLVIRGRLTIKLRDRDIVLDEGEFFAIPRGVEHKPVADDEAHVVLIEPKTARSTGNVTNERTIAAEDLEWI